MLNNSEVEIKCRERDAVDRDKYMAKFSFKVGNKVKISYLNKKQEKIQKSQWSLEYVRLNEGTILHITDRFMLVQGDKYKECISLADIRTKNILVEVVE